MFACYATACLYLDQQTLKLQSTVILAMCVMSLLSTTAVMQWLLLNLYSNIYFYAKKGSGGLTKIRHLIESCHNLKYWYCRSNIQQLQVKVFS